MTGAYVEVQRGGVRESRHPVSLCVVRGDGSVVAAAGDPELVTFFRSAAKLLQALPLVEDGVADRWGYSEAELALACGSHSGEPRHVEAARSMLARVGAGPDDLACGPHPPFHERSRDALRAAGEPPSRLHNNCSGKHAGMIGLARTHGWEVAGYHQRSHPVQSRALGTVARWSGVPERQIGVAVDGCGVACFALPLRGMALAYARLAQAAGEEPGSPAARVIGAISAHPGMIAGEGRLCTELMQRRDGELFAKVGAEGVYCVGFAGAGLGLALKVEDGSERALPPALLGVLHALGWIDAADLDALARFARPAVHNTRGEVVGELRPCIQLAGGNG